MPALPSGTVTFLFSDIEHSTRLLQHLGDRYADVLAEYQRLLRETFQAGDGHEIDTAGDGVFRRLPTRHARRGGGCGSSALAIHPWPEGASVRAYGLTYR